MSSSEPVLAVCINWNGRRVLRETVSALQSSDYPSLQILVVDNDSTDGSMEELDGTISALYLPSNQGYGGAINAALNAARLDSPFSGGTEARLTGQQLRTPEYFFVINNDLTVEHDTVRRLVEFSKERNAGVVGPKILAMAEPSRLEAAWGKVTWSHVLAHFEGKWAADGPRWNQPKEVELLLGSALLVRRAVFDRIGGFDPHFFMYHEEVDFLYRARNAGFSIFYCPSAQVRHYAGWATREQPWFKVFWTRRNAVYFLKKHRAGPLRWTWFAATLAGSLAANFLSLRLQKCRVILSALREGLRA